MQIRKDQLTMGQSYHVFSRSIAEYVIFNNPGEYSRIVDMISLYQYCDFNYKYSRFIELNIALQTTIRNTLKISSSKYVDIIAYCIMPTHIHLILKQIMGGGISIFISKVLNSYTRYFNLKHKRVGPLWSGRFKNVIVKDDDQMLHLTRYVHLNPSSAGIVKKPTDWSFSSFKEYIDSSSASNHICQFHNILDITPKKYKLFVNDYKDFQHSISSIKKHLIDEYTG